MRIVMDHITRMREPRICIAGIDPDTGEHVRPTTPPEDLITRKLLAQEGGPISMGAEVELGDVQAHGTAPETEDHVFSTTALQHVRDLGDEEFTELLDCVAAQDLTAAFGPALKRHNWKYAIDPGTGQCSLAVLRCSKTPRLEVDGYGKLQLRWSDPDPQTYLSVTDVRFYQEDHQQLRKDVVYDVARRLRRGIGCYLLLGVTRAWPRPGDTRERHWLQLNGIVLEDRPTGREP